MPALPGDSRHLDTGESDTAAKCSMKVEDSELLMSSMSAPSQFLFMLEVELEAGMRLGESIGP